MPRVKLLDPADATRRLDRYELIGEIASGGMATVFLARLAGVGGFQRFVAIKRLHPHLASEQEFIEMFLDEARLAAGIHHPHVVPILEVGVAGADRQAASGFYLVMEYIEGDTLARLYGRGAASGRPMRFPVTIRILLDALAGLHAAHELTDAEGRPMLLVHRDCSPQNILVGVDGCSRITDFGVARAASRLSSTRADRLKGKLAYMAPEQVKGNDIDRRADVFAMGIVLWEALSGRRLFKAESEAATLSRVVNEPIPRLRDVGAGVPAALDAVCAKALEREPERRYQTAAELAEALEKAALELPAGVASPRDVANYLQEVVGHEIAAQREAVRAWIQRASTALDADRRSHPGAFMPPSAHDLAYVPALRGSADPSYTTLPGQAAPQRSSPGTRGLLGNREVIPVELPPDPPVEDDSGLVAREASLTGVLAFSRRHSVVPYAAPLAERPGTRRRGRLAGAVAMLVLVGAGLFFWSMPRPRAGASIDAAAVGRDPAVAAAPPPRSEPTLLVAAEAEARVSATASAGAFASVATPALRPPASPTSPARAGASGRASRSATPSPEPAAPADDLANPYR